MHKKLRQIASLLLVGFFLCLIAVYALDVIYYSAKSHKVKVDFGVSYSPQYASFLGLDWQKTYLAILHELGVKKLRLTSYWSSIEPERGESNFGELDYLLSQADMVGAEVVLVIGQRQPRWPECHIPAWAKKQSDEDRRGYQLQFMQKVVERYAQHPAVVAWQIENEPLLDTFGEGCDRYTEAELQEEVDLVRSLSDKKIVLTDSGELGSWLVPMKLSDEFGFTLYRKVYDPWLGYTKYPWPPIFYVAKAEVVKRMLGQSEKQAIVMELQSEPWYKHNNPSEQGPSEQLEMFTPQELEENIAFVQRGGFDSTYLWGVEWWYWMAQHGYPQYLEIVRKLF